MNLDNELGLSPEVLKILKILPLAFEMAGLGDKPVTIKTTAFYGPLKGVCIRMWPVPEPKGPNITVFIGDSHTTPLRAELWGDTELESYVAPGEDDRPEDPVILSEAGPGRAMCAFDVLTSALDAFREFYSRGQG
jgi:hypothetical protein